MLEGLRSPGPVSLLALATSCWLAACTAEAPASSESAPTAGGRGGSGGGGGARPGMTGMAGAMAGGGGGTGGSGGTAGSSTREDASAPGSRDGGLPASRDGAASDAPSSPISGFALCVVCHGPEGEGLPDKGPEIQHPVIDFSTWVVRNGRVHPAYKEPMMKYTVDQVSDAQLQGIFTFLASPPKPTTGKGLYDDYCANCHGADGKGGVTMRDISSEPVNVFITDSRGGHHPGEFENRREYMPKWTPAELSDAELRLIFAYIDSL